MSKTLIVGDVHLGKGTSLGKTTPGMSFNSRVLDTIYLLDWVYLQCEERHIDNIIFTGDIFEDSKPDYLLVNSFIEFLKKFENSGIETHIITGNHDLRRTGKNFYSILNLIDSYDFQYIFVHSITSTVHFEKSSFTFLPFFDRRSLYCETHDAAVEKINKYISDQLDHLNDSNNRIKILIGHLTLDGALYVGDEIDDSLNEIICPLTIFNGYDYVWMGHIHKPQVLSKVPYIAHIGSLDISDFGEKDHSKIMILFDDNLNSFEEIKIPTRQLIDLEFDAKNQNATDEIISCIENQNLHNSIVRVKIKLIDNSISIDRKKIETAVYNAGAHYLCAIREYKSDSVVVDKISTEEIINPEKSITKWAENNILDLQEKKEYLDYAFSLLKKVSQ